MRMRTLSIALALAAGSLFAGGGKTYQVTGPIMDIQGDVITVQNQKKELWQLTVPAGTKGFEGLKKGDKVTLMYTMSVTSIEVKGAKKEEKKAEAPKADAKKEAAPKKDAKKKAA
ncbi:MAG TPA: hypothetical protein VJ483_02075 [Holophagaceae bacterium]|nr:hypothetical protein [Holophagaceae bacterium]